MIFGEDNSGPEDLPGARKPQAQQIQLDTSTMETVYTNFFALAGSADEITAYVGANTPMPGAKHQTIRVSHRLIMLPANAKRLMIALQQTVRAHEDRFGPIELPPQQPPQRPQG